MAGLKPHASGDGYLFELACYLVTSARDCLDEPPAYGPLRLIEGVSRLADLPKHAPIVQHDRFLGRAKRRIDGQKRLVMEDREAFGRFLDSLARDFAAELRRRARRGRT